MNSLTPYNQNNYNNNNNVQYYQNNNNNTTYVPIKWKTWKTDSNGNTYGQEMTTFVEAGKQLEFITEKMNLFSKMIGLGDMNQVFTTYSNNPEKMNKINKGISLILNESQKYKTSNQ